MLERFRTPRKEAKNASEFFLAKMVLRRIALLSLIFTFASQIQPAHGKSPDEEDSYQPQSFLISQNEFVSLNPEATIKPEHVSVTHASEIYYANKPQPVTYFVKLQVQPNEEITITNISIKTYARPEQEVSNPEYDATEIIGTTITSAKPVFMWYQVHYGNEFNNTAVTQIVTVEFKTNEKNAKSLQTSANAVVIFGSPSVVRGCWPTTGYVRNIDKYPDGTYHSVTKGPSWGIIGTAVDISAVEGTKVLSPFSGTVCTNCKYANTEYGNMVTLTNTEGVDLIFAHLSAYWDGSTTSNLIKEVKIGDLLGYVGSTGESSGGKPHLHYEVPAQTRTMYLRILQILPTNTHINQVVSSDFCLEK